MSDDDNKKVNVDTGLKVALKSIGIDEVPEKVSEEEYENLSGKVSQGVRLRMEAKAREQNMVMMWKSRVNLVKQARQLMNQKAFSEAAVAYEKYLKVLELVYDLKPGGLTPELFNKSSKSKELTVITTVYWDLVRIYDTSRVYGDRQQRAAAKLAEFLPFSTIYPQVVKHAQSFQRSAKNPAVIRNLLKKVKAKTGGCIIATTVYGDGLHTDVEALRQWRDSKLSKNFSGRLFISLYYSISPRIFLWLYDQPRLKALIRSLLTRLVRHIK